MILPRQVAQIKDRCMDRFPDIMCQRSVIRLNQLNPVANSLTFQECVTGFDSGVLNIERPHPAIRPRSTA